MKNGSFRDEVNGISTGRRCHETAEANGTQWRAGVSNVLHAPDRMDAMKVPYVLLLGLSAAIPLTAQNTSEPPTSWVDPDTGHRIVRLTDEPNSASLYFNQNGYTADGKKMIYTTPGGISVLDLETHETKPVVEGRVRVIVTGHKTQNVYYIKGGAVYCHRCRHARHARDRQTASARFHRHRQCR